MTIIVRTCLVITCTRCGQYDDECPDIHATSIQEAHAWFTTWQWNQAGEPDLCPGCVADLACERDGHQWSDWRTPVVPGYERLRFRTCQQCHDGDVAPVANPEGATSHAR